MREHLANTVLPAGSLAVRQFLSFVGAIGLAATVPGVVPLVTARGLAQDVGAVRVLNHATVQERGFNPTRLPTDAYGTGVARLGDVDADGIADLALGNSRGNETSQNASDGGRMTVLFLRSDGSIRSYLDINRPGWLGGNGIASLGDIDGNGYADFAAGSILTPGGGQVTIFKFAAGQTFVESVIAPPPGFPSFGRALAWQPAAAGGGGWLAVGDGNAFGTGAVVVYRLDSTGAVVGSPQNLTSLGFTGALAAGDYFGVDLAYADKNADGIADLLLVGASLDDTGGSDCGAVWVCNLSASGQVTGQTKITQQTPGFRYALSQSAWFGGSIALVPDVDGDGLLELCVSAAGWNAASQSTHGVVHCLELDAAANIVSITKIHQDNGGDFLHPSWGGVSLQSPPLAHFGYDIAFVGDTDGDGRLELMVGAPSTNGGGTALLVNLGPQVASEPAPRRTPILAPLECNNASSPGHDQSVVNRASGEFANTRVDVRIPGRGMPLLVQRTTRTRTPSVGANGNNANNALEARLRRNGTDLFLCDGMGNADRFLRQTDGSWTAPGVFRRITRATDAGEYTVTFENTATWEFHPTDGSPMDGKLRAIRDRNGNMVTLFHDAQGQLTRVNDSVGRDATFTYDAAGRMTSVRDCAGRVTTYAYYQSAEAGGTEGDLKSVTTPPVTGTPHGNDFPAGKTTTYTYTRGFSDAALNSDLLTITDAKGQTYLTNVYAHTIAASDPRFTTSPSSIYYDRIVRQIAGDPGDVIDWVYEAQTPSAANHFAIIKVIENDRVGNVTEFFYDANNQEVIRREYTGRAPDPDNLTSSTVNRPTSPLRATDPPYFETRWQYNQDGLVTRVDYPEGDFTRNVYEIDLNPSADPISRGNLREVHHDAGPRGSQLQQVISRFFTYRTGGGGCCGTNFVLTETDARGAVTTHQYDAVGNRTRTTGRLPGLVDDWTYNALGQITSHTWPALAGVRRVDTFSYYTTGPQTGFLQAGVVDQGGLLLATTYEHDCVGNLTRSVDPRGKDTLYVLNALDQVVAEYTPEVTTGSGVRYETLTWYDANDNVVRVDVENRDENGVRGANTHFTTTYDHDILDEVIRVTRELTPGTNVVEEYAYDANRNPTLVRKGEATSGGQPGNVEQTTYDERNLPFRKIHAPGTADQSTSQQDYDRNGNRRFLREGLESSPRLTEWVYDGHDRLQDQVDPMGNLHTYRYDANANLTQASVLGQLVDDANPGPRVLLFEQVFSYDAADRMTGEQVRHFDPTTGTPIGDGNSTATHTYDGPSLLAQSVDDRGNATTYTYDTAHRQRTEQDAKGNRLTLAYDAASNVTSTREDDVADSGAPLQTFTTTYEYDGLDREVRATDGRGNVSVTAYDSRANLVRTLDALGNEARYEYDGLSRLLRSIRDLNGNGASASDPADIVTQQTWDHSSRLVARTDDNGNASVYVYDALDRRIEERAGDGTRETTAYDVHHDPVTMADANGSVVTSTYDLLGRLAHRAIVPGPRVSAATTFEDYRYDGYSRVIRLEDDDSIVLRSYDSMDNVVEETLNGRSTQATYDGMQNELTRAHPGGTLVQSTWDALDRVRTVGIGGPFSTYDYVGPGRIERRTDGNGTQATIEYDGYASAPVLPGDFGVGKVVRTRHEKTAGSIVLDEHTYTWNPVGSKTQRRDVRSSGPQIAQQFSYDRAQRMTRSTRTGAPASEYSLDGVNNRTNPGYHMSAFAPVPADHQVNQYTKTARDLLIKDGAGPRRPRVPPSGTDARLYDDNGNLTRIDSRAFEASVAYDYADQMVAYEHSGKLTTYRYDALGRRFHKASGALSADYIWFGRQLVEERVGGSVVAVYGYGAELDAPAFMVRMGQLYVFHTDDQGSITAITDTLGDVVERYDYCDFGGVQFFGADSKPRMGSAIGNAVLYNGRWLDAESGFYYFRTRYLEPAVGRFTTRDTIGVWADAAGLGNGHVFVGNNPWSLIDPMGTAAGEGISNVELGLKKKPGGQLTIAAPPGGKGKRDVNPPAAGEGISNVELGLKKKPGGELTIAAPPGGGGEKDVNPPAAGEGISNVELGLKKKPGGQIFASSNHRGGNHKELPRAAGEGISNVELGLKKKPGGQIFATPNGMGWNNKPLPAAWSNTSRSSIKDPPKVVAVRGGGKGGGPPVAVPHGASSSNIKNKPGAMAALPRVTSTGARTCSLTSNARR